MICQRSYSDCYQSNLNNIINQIKNYATWVKEKLGDKIDTFNWNIPSLKLRFDHPKHLHDNIEELSRKHCVDIKYMSNLKDHLCVISICFSYDTIKKRKLDPLTYVQNYDFDKLIKNFDQEGSKYEHQNNLSRD